MEGSKMVPIYRNRKSGFTMVELLVVIAIIAILAAFLMSAMSSGSQASKITLAQSTVKDLYLAIESFKLERKYYPRENENANFWLTSKYDMPGTDSVTLKNVMGHLYDGEYRNDPENTLNPDKSNQTPNNPTANFTTTNSITDYFSTDNGRVKVPAGQSDPDFKCLLDPWNQPYVYVTKSRLTSFPFPGEWDSQNRIDKIKHDKIVIFSLGPDGFKRDSSDPDDNLKTDLEDIWAKDWDPKSHYPIADFRGKR